jgi:hypothetical protein
MDDSSKISIILRQTNLSEEDAKKYLDMYEGDISKVIRRYLLGDKADTFGDNKPSGKIQFKDLNQEMYKQIRQKLELCEEKKRG